MLTAGSKLQCVHFSLISFLRRPWFTLIVQTVFQCTECSKVLKSKDGLAYHMRSHQPASHLSCSYCGRKFVTKQKLAFHLNTHTGDRPYRCSNTGESYRSRNSWSCKNKTILTHEFRVFGGRLVLNVVTNEKQGVSGRWQMIDIGLGPLVIDVLFSFCYK